MSDDVDYFQIVDVENELDKRRCHDQNPNGCGCSGCLWLLIIGFVMYLITQSVISFF